MINDQNNNKSTIVIKYFCPILTGIQINERNNQLMLTPNQKEFVNSKKPSASKFRLANVENTKSV